MSNSEPGAPRTESCTAECRNGRHGLGCPHDLEKIVGEGVPSAEQWLADRLHLDRDILGGFTNHFRVDIERLEAYAALRETAARAQERQAAIKECIHEVATGRTINNFGHVPEVRRALEWVLMDLQSLSERAKR